MAKTFATRCSDHFLCAESSFSTGTIAKASTDAIILNGAGKEAIFIGVGG